MKQLVLVSAIAALPFAAHAADIYGDNVEYNFIQDNAPAQPAVVGHLSLGAGYFEFSVPGCELATCQIEEWIFTGVGRANIDLGAFNLEIETGGGSVIFDDGGNFSSIGVAAHLWGRLNHAALGVYGAVNFPNVTLYTVGAETEAYFGPVTLGVAGEYNWVEGGRPANWNARGWLDLYVTPNARIGGEVTYASFDDTPTSTDREAWRISVDGEYRFAGTPFSIWAVGNYYTFSADCTTCAGLDRTETWSGLLGFRVLLDGRGTTLQEHDMYVPWDGGIVVPIGLVSNGTF